MKAKRSSIANLYKPQYLEDKKEQAEIDHYIKLEGDNFIGKIGIGTSELVKWRAKAQVFKVIIDQARLYEVKKIIQRYEFERKERLHGFSNEYISTLSDLLTLRNQKLYLPRRLQMLKTRNHLVVPEPATNSRAKKIEKIKNQFYITSYIQSRDKTRQKLLDPLNSSRNPKNSCFSNKKQSYSLRKSFNPQTQFKAYAENKTGNEDEEDQIMDPDRDNLENMKYEDNRVNKLQKDYPFFTLPSKTKKMKRHIALNSDTKANVSMDLSSKTQLMKKRNYRKRKKREGLL